MHVQRNNVMNTNRIAPSGRPRKFYREIIILLYLASLGPGNKCLRERIILLSLACRLAMKLRRERALLSTSVLACSVLTGKLS